MNKLKVYIASPYTNGNTSSNVRRSLDAMHVLMDYDFVAFSPLLNHFAEIHKSRSEMEWFKWDLEWLLTCDILVRIRPVINGEELTSKGADEEEELARKNGLLVFTFITIDELKKWAENTNKDELKEFLKLNLPSR